MKLFKATLKPKKVIRDIHEEITIYSNEYKFKKDFIEHCNEKMEADGYSLSQWFAPIVEIASEDEYNAAMQELENKAQEVEDLDQIEDDEPSLQGESFQDNSSFYYPLHIKNPQILIKVDQFDSLDGIPFENYRSYYSIDGGLFIEIDGTFKTNRNAIENALGAIVDTINEMKESGELTAEEQAKAVKAIQARGPGFWEFWKIEPSEAKSMLDHTVHDFRGNQKQEKYPQIMDAILFAQMNSELLEQEPASICYEAMETAIDDTNEMEKHEGKSVDFSLLVEKIQNVANFNLMARYQSCLSIVSGCLVDEVEDIPASNEVEKPEMSKKKPEPNPEPEKKENKAEIKAREKAEAEKAEQKRREEIEQKEKIRQEKIKAQIESINERLYRLKSGELLILDDVPNEVYHRCDGVSSSNIKDAIVSLYYYDQKHNKKEIERKENPNFAIGSLFHSLTLEPSVTDSEFYNSGEETRLSKAFKNTVESFPHLTVLTKDEWELAERLRHEVLMDNEASRLIDHELRKSERSYFKRDEETGLIIKCRPDVEVGNIIADLKSVGVRANTNEKYTLNALKKDVQFLHYDLSAAMYLDITGKSSFVWIFANKEKGNHWVCTAAAGDETLNYGFEKYRSYLNKISDCLESGEWPKPESLQAKIENGKIKLPTL